MATPKEQLENDTAFTPRFDDKGLVATIVTDAQSGGVLMFAFMNDEALRKTIETGEAHFWSRSRGKLWRKGETSGNVLTVKEMRTDCDQDCIWLRVTVGGDEAACHTGQKSCFYRRVEMSTDKPAHLSYLNDP
jgi:phosphoribosyl-AMP cyclohydrolase